MQVTLIQWTQEYDLPTVNHYLVHGSWTTRWWRQAIATLNQVNCLKKFRGRQVTQLN